MRDIVRAADKAGLMDSLSKPYYVSVPGPRGRPVEVAMFLPHEVYHNIVGKSGGTERWRLPDDRLNEPAGLGALLRTWGDHPSLTQDHELANVAIFGLHADAISYTSTMRAGGSKSVLVASWNAISARTLEYPIGSSTANRPCLSPLSDVAPLSDRGPMPWHPARPSKARRRSVALDVTRPPPTLFELAHIVH